MFPILHALISNTGLPSVSDFESWCKGQPPQNLEGLGDRGPHFPGRNRAL